MTHLSRRQFATLGGLVAAGACSPSADTPDGPSPRPSARSASRPLRPSIVHRADQICQAYALNTKTYYASSVYGHTDAVISLVEELGVRTIRERATTGSSQGVANQRYAMPLLAERGIRWHATVGELADWQRAQSETSDVLATFTQHYQPILGGKVSELVHSFGGCNEVDGPVVNGNVDPRWAQHARLMQNELWRQTRADSRFDDVPIAGPSTRTDFTIEKAEQLGDLSSISDWGNAHFYNAGTSPTRGIDDHLDLLSTCFPDARTWFVTESGYNDSPQTNAGRTVSEDAAATYAIRGICDFFLRGCIYGRFELLDDPDPINYATQQSINETAEPQAHYGMVAMSEESVAAATPDTWRKKPEFHATKRFLRLLSDRGPVWTPEQLDIVVEGGGLDLQHILAQKRDGRHYLLLWRDVAVATTYPDARPLDVLPVNLTVRLLGTPRPMAIYSPRVAGAALRRQAARNSITVDVAGDLAVLEIG